MTAQTNFRTSSFVSGLAIKAPCNVATTIDITLSGEQTVNGVALLIGDRCLVKDQTDTLENGIYTVQRSAWNRSGDFDGNRDIVGGTIVPAYRDSDGVYVYWALDEVPGSLEPGVDAITFINYFDPAIGPTITPPLDFADDEQIRFGDSQDVAIEWNAALGGFHVVGAAPSQIFAFKDGQVIRLYNDDDDAFASITNAGTTGVTLLEITGTTISLIGAVSITGNVNMQDNTIDRAVLKDYAITDYVNASASGVLDIDFEDGQSQYLALTENVTSMTFSNWPAAGLAQVELELLQDSSARTVAWAAAIEWPGGVAPDITTIGSKHLIHFRSRNAGTNILATFLEGFS